MYSKDGSSITASGAAVLSGATSLVTLAAVFFAGATALKSYNPSQKISLDLDSWSWLGKVEFKLDHLDPAAPEVAALPALPELPAALQIKAPIQRRVVRHRILAKQARTSPHKVSADKIQVTQAAAVAPPAPATPVEQNEHERMQSLHTLLRGKFLMAARPAAQLNTQLAQSSVTQHSAQATPEKAGVTKHFFSPKKVSSHFQAQRRIAKSQARSAKENTEKSNVNVASALSTHSQERAQAQMTATRSTDLPIVSTREVSQRPVYAPEGTSAPQNMGSVKIGETPKLTGTNTATDSSIPRTQKSVSDGHSDTHPQSTSTIMVPGSSYALTRGYSDRLAALARALYGMVGGVTTQPNGAPKVNTHHDALTGGDSSAALTKTDGESPSASLHATGAADVTQQLPCLAKAGDLCWVEAFDWYQPLVPYKTEVISREVSENDQKAGGWEVAAMPGHWPTLLRRSPALAPKGTSAPILSENTAQFLARASKVSIQRDAGIIFGKIQGSSTIEFSGRAERALYLNAEGAMIDPTIKTSEIRFFVLLNAAPGAHFLYASDSSGEAAGVAVPVIHGTATYLDLTHSEFRRITGKVLNTQDDFPAPQAGAHVQVLGSAHTESFTDRRGNFSVHGIKTFADYPIYVEISTGKSFTHRYQVNPSQMLNRSFYLVGDQQVQDWINQLEGGLSPDSGMIVAAAPNMASALEKEGLYPSARALNVSTLSPETYTVSREGQLLVDRTLESDTFRFVSVQVPEGPVVVQMETKGREPVWSELHVASPGVINVIGPY